MGKPAAKAKPLVDTHFRDTLHAIAGRQKIKTAAGLRRVVGTKIHRNTVGQWWRGEVFPDGRQFGWLIQALDMSFKDIEELCGPPPAVEQARKAALEKETRRHVLRRGGVLDQLQSGTLPRAPQPSKGGGSA